MRQNKYFIILLIIFLFNEIQLNKIYSKERQFEKINSNDYIILGSAGLINLTNLFLEDYSNSNLNAITNLDKSNINFLDKNFVFSYNKDIKLSSDIALGTTLALPVIYSLFNSSDFGKFFNYNIKYAQVLGLTSSLVLISKNFIDRYRPYTYDKNLDVETRKSYDGRNSFFSGHTAIAFSSAVFLAYNIENSDYSRTTKNLVWAGSLALASSTGVLRILAGKHFLTDVLVGAVVGSAIAILISEKYYENIFINKTSLNFENLQINYLTFKFKI